MENVEIEQVRTVPVAGASNLVRVSLPAAAYYNLDRFQVVQRDILERLGCGGCHSGFDIRYALQRQFVVNEQLVVTSLPQDPIPFC